MGVRVPCSVPEMKVPTNSLESMHLWFSFLASAASEGSFFVSVSSRNRSCWQQTISPLCIIHPHTRDLISSYHAKCISKEHAWEEEKEEAEGWWWWLWCPVIKWCEVFPHMVPHPFRSLLHFSFPNWGCFRLIAFDMGICSSTHNYFSFCAGSQNAMCRRHHHHFGGKRPHLKQRISHDSQMNALIEPHFSQKRDDTSTLIPYNLSEWETGLSLSGVGVTKSKNTYPPNKRVESRQQAWTGFEIGLCHQSDKWHVIQAKVSLSLSLFLSPNLIEWSVFSILHSLRSLRFNSVDNMSYVVNVVFSSDGQSTWTSRPWLIGFGIRWRFGIIFQDRVARPLYLPFTPPFPKSMGYNGVVWASLVFFSKCGNQNLSNPWKPSQVYWHRPTDTFQRTAAIWALKRM